MRMWVVLLALALAGAATPAGAKSPIDAIVERARGVKPAPRFPFGFTPATDLASLAGDVGSCLPADAAGGRTCWLSPSPKYAIDAGAFRPRSVSARFTPAHGGMSLYGVTLSMEGISSCQEMADAFASAMKMVVASYGKPQRMDEGPRFGSTRCSDWAREGRVFYRAFYKDWRLTVDAYQGAAGWTVYLGYLYEASAELHLELLQSGAR